MSKNHTAVIDLRKKDHWVVTYQAYYGPFDYQRDPDIFRQQAEKNANRHFDRAYDAYFAAIKTILDDCADRQQREKPYDN